MIQTPQDQIAGVQNHWEVFVVQSWVKYITVDGTACQTGRGGSRASVPGRNVQLRGSILAETNWFLSLGQLSKRQLLCAV